MTKRALVLGGGGVAGIAWETGLLFGLAERGIDVLAADLIVGTSAGSTVAAQITSGEKLAALHDRLVFPEGESTEMAVEFNVEQMVADWGRLMQTHAPGVELRAAIGSYALAAATPSERRRREVIAARLPKHEWPDHPIKIVAIDAATGEERIFTAADGVDMVDAIAASSAVPGVWPPVSIEGRRYIDGGVRSPVNLDAAAGHDIVLVLAPSGELGPIDPAVAKAAQKVEKKAKVLVLRPDEAALAAMGLNPLDPATAQPSAQAGRAQAEALADDVRELWETE